MRTWEDVAWYAGGFRRYIERLAATGDDQDEVIQEMINTGGPLGYDKLPNNWFLARKLLRIREEYPEDTVIMAKSRL